MVKRKKFECNTIYAEEGDDFQQYVYANGKKVLPGTPIGKECRLKNGEWKLKLKANIYYSND
jgi:hypothetical protein